VSVMFDLQRSVTLRKLFVVYRRATTVLDGAGVQVGGQVDRSSSRRVTDHRATRGM